MKRVSLYLYSQKLIDFKLIDSQLQTDWERESGGWQRRRSRAFVMNPHFYPLHHGTTA